MKEFMRDIKSIDDINKAYRDLWKTYGKKKLPVSISKYLMRWPLQYDLDIKPQKLLFVGFNPSFDEDKDNSFKFLKDGDLDDQNIINQVVEYERTAQRGNKETNKERYTYYSLFPEITQNLGLGKDDWNHIDLLPFREKSQNTLLTDLGIKRDSIDWMLGNESLKGLLNECFEVFLGFIEYLKPKVIVVVNGFISRTVIDCTGSHYITKDKPSKPFIKPCLCKSDFFSLSIGDSKNQVYRILRIKNEYPVLLSSMLTGRRALDLGSRERLIWHINSILQ